VIARMRLMLDVRHFRPFQKRGARHWATLGGKRVPPRSPVFGLMWFAPLGTWADTRREITPEREV
jgi:hypothetical protein